MAGVSDLNRILDDRSHDCWVHYLPAFIPPTGAEQLGAQLAMLAWQRPPVRGVAPLRGSLWFAALPAHVYRFGGHEWQPQAMPPWLGPLTSRVASAVGCQFDSALATHYPDGAAGVGWHDDDDYPGACRWPIAVVSLGAERRLAFRRRGQSERLCQIDVASGSLLVMAGQTQRHYQHTLLPTGRSVAARTSLSFRRFGEASSSR